MLIIDEEGQGVFSLRLFTANSWNSLTVCVFTVHTRHNLQDISVKQANQTILMITEWFNTVALSTLNR